MRHFIPTGGERARPPARSRAAADRCEDEACAAATTTVRRVTEARAGFIAGFVAAEGCFTRSGRSFRFAVGLGATDGVVCEELHRFFGVGSIITSPRRRAHYDDEIAYHVQALPDLVEVVVPFMDAHLPASYKRDQYLAWRAALLEYWEREARRVRPCRFPGCDEPRRIDGLCRPHFRAAVR